MIILAVDQATTIFIIWFAVIVLSGMIEAITMDLSSVWFAVGGIFSLIVAIIWPELIWLQVLIFLIVSSALLLLLRPLFKRYIKKNQIKTNADALVGKIGICLKPILDGERGEVKIEGKIWTAIANENIQADERVVILAIKGVKLVVKKE